MLFRLAAKLVLTFVRYAVLKKTLTIVIPDLECKAKTARESIVSILKRSSGSKN